LQSKDKRYSDIYQKAKSVLASTNDLISSMAAISCLIKEAFPEVLWAGFYRAKKEELLIGPYQGSLGCTNIKFGKGVCGAAAKNKKTLIVQNVHEFSGHIACDSRSNSEIVVPVFSTDESLIAVLDLDSENFSQFDEKDKNHLEKSWLMNYGPKDQGFNGSSDKV